MDFEQLLWLRDTSEETLTSEMFRGDTEYERIRNECDTKISKEKIETMEL